MPESQRSSIGPSLLISMSCLALGVVLGIAVHSIVGSRASGGAAQIGDGPITRAEWEDLRASLARLEAAARRRELVAPAPRVEVGTTAVSEESVTSLAESVRALRDVVERLRASIEGAGASASAGASPREIVTAAPVVDWEAIEDLRELYGRDEAAAWRSVMFSTPSEILARFGEPTLVYRYHDGLALAYTREVEIDDEETEERGVRFAFADGVLDSLWTEP